MEPDRAADRLARWAGLLLLAVPWLPLQNLFGPLQGAGAVVPPGEWALGLAVFLPAAWLAARTGIVGRIAAAGRPSRDRMSALGIGSGTAVAVLAGLVAGGLVLAAAGVYGGAPRLVDGAVQLFQARIFAGGAAAAPVPPGDAFFSATNVIVGEGGWYTQYPPGHPALLAAGMAAGVPWLVPLALSLGSALLLFRFADLAFDRTTALATLALTAICPFFWFLGAGFMSHVPALFFASLLLWALARSGRRGGGIGSAAVAGGALGALLLCRPLTAVALGVGTVPFLADWLRDEDGGGRWRRPTAFLLPAAVAAVLFLAYNAVTTGHPLRPGYLELWGGAHGLGFHATPWGGAHTPLDGLANELLDLSLLNLFLFEWPIPALLPVGAALAAGWLERPWDRRLTLLFLALPAAYFFYWHRDALMGPRFLYAGLAPLLPLTARALVEGGRRLGGRELRALPGLAPVSARSWAAGVLALCVLYAAAVGIPGRFRVHASGGEAFRTDLRTEARRAGIDRALIFVPVSWGSRLIAELRGLGAPAGLVERAYRSTDHCALDGLVRRAREEGWTVGRVRTGLERLLRTSGPLVRTDRLNGDGTLRLARERSSLPPRCREELAHDRGGWTSYVPHLPENDPWLTAPFVVARDLRGRNRDLRRVFPDRPAYLYRDGRFRRLEDPDE